MSPVISGEKSSRSDLLGSLPRSKDGKPIDKRARDFSGKERISRGIEHKVIQFKTGSLRQLRRTTQSWLTVRQEDLSVPGFRARVRNDLFMKWLRLQE